MKLSHCKATGVFQVVYAFKVFVSVFLSSQIENRASPKTAGKLVMLRTLAKK